MNIKTLTIDEVKAMEINKLTDMLEKRLKRKLPMEMKLKLAMLHGAKEQGIKVYELDRLIEYREFINYDGLTSLLNELEG